MRVRGIHATAEMQATGICRERCAGFGFVASTELDDVTAS